MAVCVKRECFYSHLSGCVPRQPVLTNSVKHDSALSPQHSWHVQEIFAKHCCSRCLDLRDPTDPGKRSKHEGYTPRGVGQKKQTRKTIGVWMFHLIRSVLCLLQRPSKDGLQQGEGGDGRHVQFRT